ncbi:hypothetical protein, partial [Klebsiella pneumoniae]|uniref:hypothetical protein n=1 Tax=Klebsiella pneumoniae TaxID=573 RepID=UPI0013D6D85C
MAIAEKSARPKAGTSQKPPVPRAVDRADRSGSTTMVLAVALVLVGAALFFLTIGRDNAYP